MNIEHFVHLVISLVLATDMANHASLIERMSTYFFFKETNSTTTAADSKTLLQTLLHAADISNAAKPWSIYIQSAEKIMEEFFIQGDLEKINYEDDKPTFDRESTDIVTITNWFYYTYCSSNSKLNFLFNLINNFIYF